MKKLIAIANLALITATSVAQVVKNANDEVHFAVRTNLLIYLLPGYDINGEYAINKNWGAWAGYNSFTFRFFSTTKSNDIVGGINYYPCASQVYNNGFYVGAYLKSARLSEINEYDNSVYQETNAVFGGAQTGCQFVGRRGLVLNAGIALGRSLQYHQVYLRNGQSTFKSAQPDGRLNLSIGYMF